MFTAYLTFPDWIKPEIIPGIKLGSWYGLMYLVAFGVTWLLFYHQVKQKRFLLGLDPYDDPKKLEKNKGKKLLHQRKYFSWLAHPINAPLSKPLGSDYSTATLSSFFTWIIIGLLIGARVFSVYIYSDDRLDYLIKPWLVFWPFETINGNFTFTGLRGMSYHGGAVGVFVAGFIFCYVKRLRFFEMADMIIMGTPLGYTFGRLGNFINQELYGRVTDSSIGMVFDTAERFSARTPWVKEIASELGMNPYGMINLPRHATQLYEAFFEGIVLWLVLWFIVSRFKKHNGQALGLYFFGYGFFRFIIEYFRVPDANLGYVLNFTSQSTYNTAIEHPIGCITMGQILCFLMMLGGLAYFFASPWFCKLEEKIVNRPVKEKKKK